MEYASNGVVLKIANYENDLLEGVLEEFEFNGRLARKENYYHGRKNGPYVSYHENGQLLKKCFYRDDILSGPYEEYFVNGVLFKKGICVDGQLYSIEDYEKLKKQEREKLNLKLMTLNGWKRPTQERKMVKRQLVEEYRLNFPKTR